MLSHLFCNYFDFTSDPLNRMLASRLIPRACQKPIACTPSIAGSRAQFHNNIVGSAKSSENTKIKLDAITAIKSLSFICSLFNDYYYTNIQNFSLN